MNSAWFVTLGCMLTAYAILDGFDLGIGSMHLLLGKNDAERRTHFNIIGPFWFGYEVWLVAAGGSMVAAFPRLYAASFSGFYLVLTLVLWLLIARGSAIEFRSHVASPLWRGFWDVAFCGSSLLLTVLFGAAVGNVVRGVPLDADGTFQGSFALALNPYALLIGVLSAALLAMHGANLVAFKTEGEQQSQARQWAGHLWIIVALLSVGATIGAFFVRPGLTANFVHVPALFLLPCLALLSFATLRLFLNRADDRRAVFAGSAFLAALMGSAGASLYPLLLPTLGKPGEGLSVFNAAAPRHDLATALASDLISLAVVIGYSVYSHRVFRGTVTVDSGEHGY